MLSDSLYGVLRRRPAQPATVLTGSTSSTPSLKVRLVSAVCYERGADITVNLVTSYSNVKV